MAAQSFQGEGENGGEHDGFEGITAEQGHERHGAQVENHQQRGDDRSRSTPEEHLLGPYTAHDPTSHETAHHEQSQSAERQNQGGIAGVHPSHLGHVVDEEAVDGNLGHLVGKQGNQAEDKQFMGPEADVVSFAVHFLLVGYLGQTHPHKSQGGQQYNHTHHGVREGHIAAGPFVLVGKQEDSCQNRGKDASHSVERLGKIQAAGCSFLRPQFRDIRIGGRFQEGQSASDDEQGEQKEIKRHPMLSGNEQQGADAIQQQSQYHAPAVSVTVDEQSGGDGHDEITHVHRSLNHGRVGTGDGEQFLKMLVQHIQNGMGKSPQEKE